jgi:Tfp pilus assembly protein PilF
MLYHTGHTARAIADYEKAIQLDSDDHKSMNNLAWGLAVCPELELRDHARSVAMAEKAWRVSGGWHDNTLGVAQYRAGQFNATIETLNRRLAGGSDQSSYNTLFLAMAHWQLGEYAKARDYFAQAVEYTAQHDPKNAELIRFQAEAAALLDIEAD